MHKMFTYMGLCTDNRPKLLCTGHGFHLPFANGYALSVQWGAGNYCDARSYGTGAFHAPLRAIEHDGHWSSPDAEVAIFDPDDSFVSMGGDDVAGWVPATTIPRIIAAISRNDIPLAVHIANGH